MSVAVNNSPILCNANPDDGIPPTKEMTPGSPRGHVISSIYYINTNEIPNHFTLIAFWFERCDLLCSHSKGDIFTCEDNMLISHVKISSFVYIIMTYLLALVYNIRIIFFC